MRQATVFSLGLLLCLPLLARAQEASAPATSVPPGAALNHQQSGDADSALINQLLTLLDGAIITKLDARVSLESFKVESGRVHLEGVLIKNFELGLRLNTAGTQRLIKVLQDRYGRNASGAQDQWSHALQILKLGIFDKIEIAIRLRELKVRRLALDSEGLQLEGLLLQIGATPNDPVTGKPKSDTIGTLIDFLRRTALNRIKVHAGLEHLAARQLRLDLEGVELQGFSVGVALLRQGNGAS